MVMPASSSTTSTPGIMAGAGCPVCVAICLSVMVVSSLDFDALGLRLLMARDADAQDAIAVGGADALGVDVLGQADGAAEFAREALGRVDAARDVALGEEGSALAGDGQHATVHGDVDLLRVEARRERVDLDGGRGAADVDRWEGALGDGADAARQPQRPERRLHVPLQPLDLI